MRKKIGILRIRHDTSTPTISDGACREVLTTGVRSVMQYWEDCTHGYLDLSESVIFPWLDMTFTISDTIPAPNVPGALEITRVTQAKAAIAALRTSRPGQDPLSGFDGLMIITLPGGPFALPNPDAGQTGQPATLPVSFDGGASGVDGFPIAAIPVLPSSHTFTTHELGHVLGLDHSYGLLNGGSNWDPTTTADDWLPVYGSPYDIMSGESFGGGHPAYSDPFSPAAGVSPSWPGAGMAQMGPALSMAYLFFQWPDALAGRVIVRDMPRDDTVGGVRLSHSMSSGTKPLALVLRPVPAAPDGVGTVIVEYRTNSSWDSGLDLTGADVARAGVVVHTLQQTPEGVRPWYQGTVATGSIDTDVAAPGGGCTIGVHSFDEDGSASVYYRAADVPALSISSIDRVDSVIDGQVTKETRTPCGDVVQFGRWRMSTRETFSVQVAGMGSSNPADPAITVEWSIQGTVIAPGTSTIAVTTAAAASVMLTATLDTAGQTLVLASTTADQVAAAVVATATDAAGVTATGMVRFEAGGYDGIHPEHLKHLSRCVEDNIARIPMEVPKVFQKPPRDPQYLQDLWKSRALREVERLEGLDVDAQIASDLRQLVQIQIGNTI